MPQNTRILSGNINPYSENAVIFDTTPVVQYALQQEAKKQAAQDAIDRHLQEMQVVDYSKMRPQDQADFVNSFNKDIKDYYIQNRDALRDKGEKGVAARLEMAQRMAAKKAEIGRSLQYAAEDKQLNDYLEELKKKGVEQAPQTVNVLANRGLSMYNDKFYKNPFTKETYKTNDLQDIYKDFDKEDWVKGITAGKKMNEPISVAGSEKSLPNFQKSYKTIQSYTDKDYNDILNNAALSYDTSPYIKNYFDNKFHNISDFPSVNAKFKATMGRDIQNGRDAAVALALNSVQKQIEGEKRNEDIASRYAWEHSFNENQKYKQYKLLPYTYPQGTTIKPDGKIYMNDGKTPYTGMLAVAKENIPDQVFKDIRSASNEKGLKYNEKKIQNWNSVPIYVKNGQPQYIETNEIEDDNTKGGGYFPLVPNVKGKVLGSISGDMSRSKTQGLVREIASQPKQEQPKISDYDKQVLEWVNDPKNSKHPNYIKFKNYLKRKGL